MLFSLNSSLNLQFRALFSDRSWDCTLSSLCVLGFSVLSLGHSATSALVWKMLSLLDDSFCLQERAMSLRLLSDLAAFLMGSRAGIDAPLCVMASLREKEDLVSGLPSRREELRRVAVRAE